MQRNGILASAGNHNKHTTNTKKRKNTMNTTLKLTYGVGNSVHVELRPAAEVAGHTALVLSDQAQQPAFKDPVTFGDVINHPSVKAALGHDNVNITVDGATVDKTTVIPQDSALIKVKLEDVQSTKN